MSLTVRLFLGFFMLLNLSVFADAHSGCPGAMVGGPYRKLVSNTGYRKVEGNITLPNATLLDFDGDGKPDDVGYIHFGGSAWNSAHTAHTEIDAGLKLEFIPGNAQSYKWRPFIAVSGTGEVALPNKPFIDPGTAVTLRVFVDSTADGYVKIQLVYNGITWTSEPIAAPYWTNAGTYQQLKRVNSLGQRFPGNKGSSIETARWTNLMLGNPTTLGQWTAAKTATVCTQPSGTADPSPFVVDVLVNASYYDETITINTANW
ncbi:MAG: hypothetical protein JWN60_1730 [Acidobacteria bacterium]|jgi:hypothetical protein|nr:hypothetical protein [Acidobacteriota bacterium]